MQSVVGIDLDFLADFSLNLYMPPLPSQTSSFQGVQNQDCENPPGLPVHHCEMALKALPTTGTTAVMVPIT